jgi:hypothetical protein
LPILICIIPQLWRQIHAKDYCESHQYNNRSVNEETHPFITLNGNGPTGSAQVRTNISAARQFNESPNFQRLKKQTTAINPPVIPSTTASASLNGSSAANMLQNSNTMNRNNRHDGTMKSRINNNYTGEMSRYDDVLLNSDPYMMLKNGPSAPPANSKLNYYLFILFILF